MHNISNTEKVGKVHKMNDKCNWKQTKQNNTLQPGKDMTDRGQK